MSIMPLNPALEAVVVPRISDIGGFEVRRALPSKERQMVGPFIFFDQMGPTEFVTGDGIDVRPHPHIGLGTVTYLFRGEFQHRDSVGSDQMIYPGDVNWMMAGHGVSHSERTSAATRANPHSLYGVQTWLALPEADEDRPASFTHVGKADLPMLDYEGTQARIIMGEGWGAKAPIETPSPMVYADLALEAGARVPLPTEHEDRAIYVLEGEVEIAGDVFGAHRLLVFRPRDAMTIRAEAQGARLLVVGGAPLDGPRYINWNFVSSSKEKLREARRAWIDGDFEHGFGCRWGMMPSISPIRPRSCARARPPNSVQSYP